MPDPRDRFDDPDAPVSAEEHEQAEALRAALDDPSRRCEPADLARALSAAWDPRDLSAEDHRALVDWALAHRKPAGRGARVLRVSFTGGAMLALAASVLLVCGAIREAQSPASAWSPPSWR